MAGSRDLPRAFGLVACLASALACPASAQMDAEQPFRIGTALPAGEKLQAIERAVADALGARVEMVVAGGYAELIEAQIGRRIDYAVYSAPAYAAASIRCGCVLPLAAPVDADGATGLRAVLIVRHDGDAPAGRIAIGPADSFVTRLAPLALWREAVSARAQGRLVDAASAAEAEALFLDGAVDGFFGWVPAGGRGDPVELSGGSLARLVAAGLDESEFRVAWLSPLLRNGPHAVRADMPAELVERLRAALDGRAGGMAAVSREDYAAAEAALGALRLEGE